MLPTTAALLLQVLILPNFHDFPSDAITVEFWMNSIDTCRPGVPFSYAHGEYEKQDNSFLIFNYNSFGVSGSHAPIAAVGVIALPQPQQGVYSLCARSSLSAALPCAVVCQMLPGCCQPSEGVFT